ncbi:hypothetical protein VTI28DRAFT_4215 [Corynascus sepedonium]
MKFQILASLAMVSSTIAQGVTEKIAPEGDAPNGCEPSLDGRFEITVVPLTGKAKKDLALERRAACSGGGALNLRLEDGVLIDDHERTGYIASNYQFQFDGPPQAGAIYTAGFSACTNGSLALGDSATFFQCASGTFYNLYDRWWAKQCSPVQIVILPCGSDDDDDTPGQGQHNTVGEQVITTTIVVPLSDGQPQVITTTTVIPICQIDDGQIQGHTTPCASVTTTPTSDGGGASQPPVTQISDGQIQVTPGPPVVSQISDGQPQVPPSSGGQSHSQSQSSGWASSVTSSVPAPPGPTSTEGQGGGEQSPTSAPPVVTGAAPAGASTDGRGVAAAAAAMVWFGGAGLGWF